MNKLLILFDLTRLLSAEGRSAPTGIERVEFEYARWLSTQRHSHVRFVMTAGGQVRLINKDAVPAFLDQQAATWASGAQGFSAGKAIANINTFLTGGGAPMAPPLGYMSKEERKHRRSVDAPTTSGAAFASWAQKISRRWAGEPLANYLKSRGARRPIVYLRVNWDRLERPLAIERLKQVADVKMVVLCHDVIPLDFPEYVRPRAVELFAERLATTARHADGVIAISNYSASRLAGALGSATPPMTVAHVGMTPSPPVSKQLANALADEPFFLITSTIEARKNHLQLFHVWRQLAARGGHVPKLIVAGKRGWEAQTALAMLDRASCLRPYIYEAGAIPDEALTLLRQRARAVLMPSFVEGFGLPVTEALVAGTPVIASDIPVFREVAGDAAELIDPLDGPGWRDAVTDYALPVSPRRAAAMKRLESYRTPAWDNHFETVRGFIDDVAGTQKARARRPLPVGFAGGLRYPSIIGAE